MLITFKLLHKIYIKIYEKILDKVNLCAILYIINKYKKK